MPFLVRAFPLIRPVGELQTFLATLLGDRREEADRFYGEYSVSHESAYLQETPNGPILIVVTLIDDANEAGPRYGKASEAFHTWFKRQIHHFTGIDPNEQPLGPPTVEVYRWAAR